jgi:glycosyltransferase involved in cell wall biosynthesis
MRPNAPITLREITDDQPYEAEADSGAARGPVTRRRRIRAHTGVSETTVTVVIPCYNYARYLPDAVGSALSQAGANVDVVIVDDKSTDDSLAVARKLAAIDRRVTVIEHLKNAGPVDTFNDGLAIAKGEFLVRLDADDLLTPGSLRRAIAVMQRFPSVGLVYGHPIHFSASPPAHRDDATSWTIWPGHEWLEARCRSGFNVITSPEVLMRRSVVDVVGGQVPLAHTHDMEMWLRMAAFCDIAYIRGADQAWHREHAKSLSATKVNDARDLTERRDAFDTLFRGKAGTIPQSAFLHEKARSAVAAHAVELATRQYDRGAPNHEEVAMLRDIASSLVKNPAAIAGWKGLDRRIAIGAGRAQRSPRFVFERLFRGLRFRFSRWKWHRTGEW